MQYVRFNYLDNDATLDINEAKGGYVPPGVYRGYTVDLPSLSGMELNLTTVGGIEFTYTQRDTDPNPGQRSTTRRSALVTKQLADIQEDEDITGLPVSVGDATFPRIDLVVCEHEYVFSQGASQAIYFVIEGIPAANPVAPDLTQPEIQIVIGQILIPPGTTSLSDAGVIYTPEPVPNFAGDGTVVRTFNDQIITGTKTFNGVRFDFGDSATLNAGTIELPSNRFVYLLESSGSPNTYMGVSNIQDYGRGHYFTILTDQRLKIMEGGNIGIGNGTEFYVEVGESVTFVNASGVSGLPTPIFIAIKQGDANLSHTLKMYATLKQNKPPFTAVPASVADSFIFLPQTGNYFDVDIPNPQTTGFITYLRTMYHFGDSIPNMVNEGGTRIQVRYVNNKNLTLEHDGANAPAGYKPLFIPNGANITFNTPVVLEFVEDFTYWRLVNVTSASINPITGYLNDVSHSADIATLFSSIKYRKIHSWFGQQTMTSAGTTTLRSYSMPANTLVNVGDSLRITAQYVLSKFNNNTKALITAGGSNIAIIGDNSAATTGFVSVLIHLDVTLTATNNLSRTMVANISDYNPAQPEDVVFAAKYMVLGTDSNNVTTIPVNAPILFEAKGTLTTTGNVTINRFVVELFKI